MYTVKRQDGTVSVVDGSGKTVYQCLETGWVVYKKDAAGAIAATRLNTMSDEDLLKALASAVKLGP